MEVSTVVVWIVWIWIVGVKVEVSKVIIGIEVEDIFVYITYIQVPWVEEVEQEEEWAHMWLVKVALWLPNVEIWSAEQLELSTDDSDIWVDILTISVCCETSWDISLSSSISEMNWEHVIIDLDLLASIAATTSSILSNTRLSAVTILAFFSSVLKVDTTYM